MKILVGSFQCESNTFSPHKASKEDFHILREEAAIDAMHGCKILKNEGFELIPMLYAVSLPSGEVKKKDYFEILKEFLTIAADHRDADGVYLYFHGAMQVEDIGSGEEFFTEKLRLVLGKEIPISVACDFHSVVTDRYLSLINAISGFRTAPHTDYDATEDRAARALIRLIREKPVSLPHYVRIPVLWADAAQTDCEPYPTVLEMLKEADKEALVVSASVFNGQPWIDSPYVGASVVIYGDNKAESHAKKIGEYFLQNIRKLSFKVPYCLPKDLPKAISESLAPAFISDSGDNTTAGADGKSSYLLELCKDIRDKKLLFAAICCEEAFDDLAKHSVGDCVQLSLPARDKFSKGIMLNGKVSKKGRILGFVKEDCGEGILFESENISIILTAVRSSFISPEHFSAMGIDISAYDCIFVKMGYLWPELAGHYGSTVFCLSPGSSTNDFSTLNYKNLKTQYSFIK